MPPEPKNRLSPASQRLTLYRERRRSFRDVAKQRTLNAIQGGIQRRRRGLVVPGSSKTTVRKMRLLVRKTVEASRRNLDRSVERDKRQLDLILEYVRENLVSDKRERAQLQQQLAAMVLVPSGLNFKAGDNKRIVVAFQMRLYKL